MRALVQRVSQAAVDIEGERVAQIGPGMLVFLGLTGLPILLTPFIADARGEPPGWPLLLPMGIIVVASITLAVRLLRTDRTFVQAP